MIRKMLALAAILAGLLAVACSIEILEPDYHSWDSYGYHSSRGYTSCGSCHTVVRIRVHDSGCWQCH